MKRFFLILSVLALLLCAGCSDRPSLATDPTFSTEPEVGTTEYTVTVVDDLGNPVSSGVIVCFMSGDSVTAMQTVGQDGTARKALSTGVYGIRLDFTDANAAFTYDSSVFLTENQNSATVKLSGYVPSRTLFADEKEQTAYYLEAGTTNVPVNTDGRTYFLFVPPQTGLYEFSVSGGAVIGYYGSPFFVQGESLAELTDGRFTISFSSGMVGPDSSTVVVLGVDSAQENVSVTIIRIGDAEKTLEDYEWTVYKPTVSISDYILSENVTIAEFDLTAATDAYKLILNEEDGFYHLNTKNGPLVYCKLGVNSAYLDSMEAIVEVSSVSRYFFEDDGSFIMKESYNECLLQYIACMDKESGLYPLTQDLYYILHQRGEYVGWWDPDSVSYLFTDDNGNPIVGLNHDIAWLSLCCYGVETQQPIDPPVTEPAPTDPEPTEPEPTEPEPTEPAPTDPEPTEPTEPEFQVGTESGQGTVELFYHEIMETFSFEAPVKAGEYVNYDLYRMFNMMITIESDDAYILFDGQVYRPVDGILNFPLVYASNNVSSPCSLSIGNSGSGDANFEVLLSALPGTHENPVELELGTFTTNTPEGAYQGYYYIFTAETDGTLTVSFESIDIDKDCQITVYNLYTYQQNTEINTSVSIEACAGDEIQIIIAVLDEQYEYPAATIVATAIFE